MTRLRDLDLAQHLADPARKQAFVTPMFDIVAPRYDAFTRSFSYGMDARWKAMLVARVVGAAPPAQRVLDVACGTGDLALAVAGLLPGATVAGVDISEPMVAHARARDGAARVAYRCGDIARLDEPDGSVDVITAGYAYRNVPDFRAALTEAARVLRPGGVLATLDFYLPESTLWRRLFLAYLRGAGNLIGWMWHGEPVVYGYIAASIEAFVSASAFATAMRDAGCDLLSCDRFLWGGVAIHVARKR